MAGLCKEQGCTGPARGRGMCITHYARWRKRNPDVLTVKQLTEKMLLDAMPGTYAQLMAATGLSTRGVRHGLLRVVDGVRAHIESYLPPTKPSEHWRPVYAAGPGKNAVVTEKEKRDRNNACERDAEKRRKQVAGTKALGSAGWAAALLAGVDLAPHVEDEEAEQ